MKTTIFCIVFIAFSFFFAKFDAHPSETPIVPSGWKIDLSEILTPSRCGNITIHSAHRPYDWKSNYPYHLDSIEPIQNLNYYCHGTDPIENFPNERNYHYRKDILKKTAYYYSRQLVDLNKFDQKKSFESNLFKSIGYGFEDILISSKKEEYVNGSKCIIYDIESKDLLTKFYFFKRRRYALLFSAWSENKVYFKQKIQLTDSVVNTIVINSL